MMYQLLKLQRMAQQPIPPRKLVRVPYLKLPSPHNSVMELSDMLRNEVLIETGKVYPTLTGRVRYNRECGKGPLIRSL